MRSQVDSGPLQRDSITTDALLRWTIIFVGLLTIILLPFVVWEEQLSDLANRYFQTKKSAPLIAGGAAALLATDIVLPVPSSLVATLTGALLGWQWATLVCWAGMSTSSALGYFLGLRGTQPLIRRLVGERELERAHSLAQKIGFETLVATRAIPVLAEAAALSAGLVGYPFRRFLVATTTANLGVAATYAIIGAYAFEDRSLLLAFAAAILFPLVIVALSRVLAKIPL